MAFSYERGENPPIDYPRLLIMDTDAAHYIFEDSEIQAVTTMQTLQFQSGQFWSGAQGANLPSSPVSYLRIAATLLDCLAANNARLSGMIQILDVKMDTKQAAQALRDQAKCYRETDDDAGAFMIIEQVNDDFSFRDRWWKQVQRQSIGV